jgi:hypothetical protein
MRNTFNLFIQEIYGLMTLEFSTCWYKYSGPYVDGLHNKKKAIGQHLNS